MDEKEPECLFICPTKIEKMPSGYYEGLMAALEPANSDLKLVKPACPGQA